MSGGLGARLAAARERARAAAAALKAEYDAGARGDDAPAEPIWPSAREQVDLVVGLLRGQRAADPGNDPAGDPVEPAPDVPPADVEHDADEVVAALRGVDWVSVRAATSERTGEAARSVKAMAAQVDWVAVQPVATGVSKALLAAVATGQLRVGGRLGPLVARAIADQGGLGGRVATRMAQEPTPLPDLAPVIDRVIDTTATE